VIQSREENTERVPMEQALRFGWEETKKNFWQLLGMLAIMYGVAIAHAILSNVFHDKMFAELVLMIFYIAVMILLMGGLINVALKIVRQEEFSFSDLFGMSRRILNLLAALILYGLAVGLGSLFLIVPGIILGIKLQYSPYFIVDKNMGPIEALKASWSVTRDVKLKLFLFWLLCGFVHFIGMLALGVGVIPASMVTMIANTFVYMRLVETASNDNPHLSNTQI
jgi:uncharacterized membrane protein